jgi:opacity protein-like surface antigen
LSLEAEGYYATNNLHTPDLDAAFGQPLFASVQSWGGLANLKLEAPKPYKIAGVAIAPYIAGGLGYGGVEYTAFDSSDSHGGFNWQAKAGVAIHTNSPLTWDLGYRYLATARYSVNDGAGDFLDAKTHLHVLTLGARLNF